MEWSNTNGNNEETPVKGIRLCYKGNEVIPMEIMRKHQKREWCNIIGDCEVTSGKKLMKQNIQRPWCNFIASNDATLIIYAYGKKNKLYSIKNILKILTNCYRNAFGTVDSGS